MPELGFTILLALFIIITSILALELDNMTRSVVSLWLSAVLVGLLFFAFSAYYSAIFQWIVYGGILTILFLSFVALLETKEDKEIPETIASMEISDFTGGQASD